MRLPLATGTPMDLSQARKSRRGEEFEGPAGESHGLTFTVSTDRRTA
jgi:hypothetical protein